MDDHVTGGNHMANHVTSGNHMTSDNHMADHVTSGNHMDDHVTGGDHMADHVTRLRLAFVAVFPDRSSLPILPISSSSFSRYRSEADSQLCPGREGY